MNENRHCRVPARALALSFVLALAACTTPPPEPGVASAAAQDAPSSTAAGPVPAEIASAQRLITVQSPAIRAYRRIAASHIYRQYPQRIYKGRIPALVYAVVVVETQLDAQGNVTDVAFSRTPGHATEVAPMIAALIRAASPLPSPGKLGAHTYVDVWLWDKSGSFQLATLTQGQRNR